MRDRRDIELLQEIGLRNAIARFRAESKTGEIPELGIFWMDKTGTLYAESVSLRDAVDYGECRTCEGSHHDLWSKAVSANPQWQGLEYTEIPRGRVVYKRHPKKPEFIVYLPTGIAKFKNKIIRRFNLPAAYVRFDTTDEHYRM